MQNVLEPLHELGMMEVRRGDVHADLPQHAGIGPLPHLGQRLFQHPFAEFNHQLGVVHHRQHMLWAQQTPLGVLPAQQRFHAQHLAGAQVDLGLVVQDQLSVVQCLGHAGLARVLGLHGMVALHVKHVQLVAAKTLGLAHGLVCMPQQCVGVGIVKGEQGHADAHGGIHLSVGNGVGRVQLQSEHRETGLNGGHIGLFAQQQHKLIATHACHRVARRDERLQAASDFLEQTVTKPGAVGVVDGLKMVQVEHAHRQQLLRVACHKCRVGEAFGQSGAVIEPCQCVVAGVPRDLMAQVAGFSHIAEHKHTANHQAIALANRRRGVFDGIALARSVDQHLLCGLAQRTRRVFAEGGGRCIGGATGLLIEAKHLIQRATDGLLGREARHQLGRFVEGLNVVHKVGGDDAVANARKGDFGAFLFGLQCLLGALALRHIDQRADRARQCPAGGGERSLVIRHVPGRLPVGMNADFIIGCRRQLRRA
ncbi:hypothetical protein D3C71_1237130 [compost metagenome]